RMYGYVKSILTGALLLSTCGAAQAQPSGAGYQQAWHPGDPRAASWQYCSGLISLFDKYTASRSESSDGGRNLSRVAAEIECDKEDCDDCSIPMPRMLRGKNIAPPAPPTELGLAP